MPGRHQVPARVVASPHQVSGRLLLDAGNGHLGDLAQMQEPGQVPRVTGIFSELN